MPDYWAPNIKSLCFAMLDDVLQWCRNQKLPAKNAQTMAVLEVFFYTFKYFVNSKHADTLKLCDFFEEQVLLYSVDVRIFLVYFIATKRCVSWFV